MRKLYPCASIWIPYVDLLGYEKDGEKFTLMAYLKETSIKGTTVTSVLLAHSITEEEAKKYLEEFHKWKEESDKQLDGILNQKKKKNAPIAEVSS